MHKKYEVRIINSQIRELSSKILNQEAKIINASKTLVKLELQYNNLKEKLKKELI